MRAAETAHARHGGIKVVQSADSISRYWLALNSATGKVRSPTRSGPERRGCQLPCRMHRRGLARRGGRGRRRRRWDLLKDLLVGGLQHIDLVHHLVLTGGERLRKRGETLLTGGELLDAFPQRRETLDHLLDLYRVDGGGGGRFRGDRLWRSRVAGAALLSTTGGFACLVCGDQPSSGTRLVFRKQFGC